MSRSKCKTCNKPAAVNYWRDDVCHYRSLCVECLHKKKNGILPKEKPPVPKWETSGYKKKMVCDLCKFRAQYSTQMSVAYVDGNTNNNALINLRSVCLNCADAAKRKTFIWKFGGLDVDR